MTCGDPQSVKLTTSGVPTVSSVNASAKQPRCIGIEEEVILTASMGRELTPKLPVKGGGDQECWRLIIMNGVIVVASSVSLCQMGVRGVGEGGWQGGGGGSPVVRETVGDDRTELCCFCH